MGLASRGSAPAGCHLVPSCKTGILDRCIATSNCQQKPAECCATLLRITNLPARNTCSVIPCKLESGTVAARGLPGESSLSTKLTAWASFYTYSLSWVGLMTTYLIYFPRTLPCRHIRGPETPVRRPAPDMGAGMLDIVGSAVLRDCRPSIGRQSRRRAELDHLSDYQVPDRCPGQHRRLLPVWNFDGPLNSWLRGSDARERVSICCKSWAISVLPLPSHCQAMLQATIAAEFADPFCMNKRQGRPDQYSHQRNLTRIQADLADIIHVLVGSVWYSNPPDQDY